MAASGRRSERWSVARGSSRRPRATESTLRLLAEHSDDTLYRLRLRPTRAYEYLSPGVERTTGFTAEEFREDPDLPLRRVHPDDHDVILGTRTSPEHVRHEPVAFRWRHPDGTWRWLEERLAPEVDGRGRLVAISGIVRDITHQKATEEALRLALEREQEATEQLRTRDELKTIFLSGVSHEIRTPLTGILGFATTLRDHRDRLDASEVDGLLERLTANARRIARLVDDLLDVDRLSRGDVEPVLVPTSLHALITRCADAIDLEGRPIELVLDPVVAEVDATQLERVVENLVSNAVRHTPTGCPVVVRLHEEGDEVHLMVEDRGPGVPEEHRSAIFEPFTQGESSSRSPSPGIGIGLSLVKKLVELHGGRVHVEGVEDGGARFRVVLPAEATNGSEVDDVAP